MIQLTRQDVLAHQSNVPWPHLYQIEQDLLLSLAMRAIFSDAFLRSQVAMRGGTVLPSRILRCVYEVPSVVEPGRTLEIEVEANVSERTPHLALMHPKFEFTFRDESITTSLISFHLNEMLATKMRALFQRRKGRDLFDLEVAVSRGDPAVLSIASVIEAFQHYMKAEKTHVPRQHFVDHLHDCLNDRINFCSDLDNLLRGGDAWDAEAAGALVEQKILVHLPE